MLTFLTNENQILPLWWQLVFLSPPGDYFTFNQPNIKYLYVICCFYTLGLADSKKFHHVCKFIFAIMWTCKFFARNQQKHHLAVESWSFKEAATFGSRSTEEFCATRGILRAPFQGVTWKNPPTHTHQIVEFNISMRFFLMIEKEFYCGVMKIQMRHHINFKIVYSND